MYPMLNGLKPFLGDDRLGYFVTSSRKEPWEARGLVSPPLQLMTLRSAWVAVITGPHTASSGEIVAIAFRGRPHVRSFGQPTAGLTTANQGFKLSDGSSIALAVSLDADRTGRVYGGKLDPDEIVDDAAVLDVASKWLHESSGCDAH
jgi:C-terminal processing protease CtpA/Prc